VDEQNGGKTVYRLGSLQWLGSCDIKITDNVKKSVENGGIVVGFAKNDELVAYFILEDTMKDGIRDVIADLERNGLKVYMVTGDNRNSAQRIAEKIGIKPERVFSEITPDKKAEIIRSLQANGERVAFAGDGINDAPALEVSNLGIAVSRASDIAREAADVILLNSDVHAIPEALRLAQATLRTIKQNLFWAFFYNAAAVPLAALGFLSPIVCAAAMGGSDVVVIGNALRLNRWKYKA
ncbi:MAG: HAD-IC family P-type ATPase, partial [Verrucomicrobiae bacterium]|nr:HAD-IC family P-type ATPase [Verrucomicrobiae bacterium]